MDRSLKSKRPDDIGSTQTAKNSDRYELNYTGSVTRPLTVAVTGPGVGGWGGGELGVELLP